VVEASNLCSMTWDRRTLLKRAAIGLGALAVPGALAACGGGIDTRRESADTGQPVNRQMASELVVSTWPFYIDIDPKTDRRPTLEAFKQRFNADVRWIEDINSNDEFFAKIRDPLTQGQDIGRDIIMPTDYMAARMHKLGWLEPLDRASIPNAERLDPLLADPAWDPGRRFSLPWQSFITAIGYNRKALGRELTSITDMLTDPALRNRVTVSDAQEDTLGLIMLANGDDPTHVTDDSFGRALDVLERAINTGHIRRVAGNDYAAALAKGDVVASVAYSGDIFQLALENPDLEFRIPDAGAILGTDVMCIPRGGDVYSASVFMNYYYDPVVQAELEQYLTLISPVTGTREAIRQRDPALADNPYMFPDAATREKLHAYDENAINNQDYRDRLQGVLGR
jgi:spermidine/putrescine transport system substrate-binding protein